MRSGHNEAQAMFQQLERRLGYRCRRTWTQAHPTDGVWLLYTFHLGHDVLPVAALEVAVTETGKPLRGSTATLDIVSPALGILRIQDQEIRRGLIRGRRHPRGRDGPRRATPREREGRHRPVPPAHRGMDLRATAPPHAPHHRPSGRVSHPDRKVTTTMSTLTSRTEVTNVTAIQRPGVGYIYRAIITIGLLYQALRDSVIRYAPRYQRGFRRSQEDIPEADYDLLLPINDERLQLDVRRAQAMAVKFLIALNGDPRGKRLFTSFVVWNARRGEGRPEPKLHDDGTLELRTVLTVPDTGHRHLAYFLLGSWKHQETSIPDEVTIDEGDVVSRAEIEKCLENFDPDDPTTSSLFVDIYSLDAEQEGWLYDEFNADAKPPAGAVAIDLNQQKTPSRRFVYRLMERSPIFDRTQVETRANTIGSRSRKLTTNATMESAVRPYSKRLVKLEQDGTGAYDDLTNFFAAFFAEWANHFPAFGPDASGDQRQAFRGESFALSNIMFFPLFRLVFELWEKYHGEGVEWTTQDEWRDAIARLAAKVTATDPEDPAKKIKVDFMSRKNPDWQGRILVRKFNSNGEFTGWSLSSTRQTRDAAFHQLVKHARVSLQRASAKGRRA